MVNNLNEENPKTLSLIDQILDSLFTGLENQDGFSNDLIVMLSDLAKQGELTKAVKVTNALKTTQGSQDETY